MRRIFFALILTALQLAYFLSPIAGSRAYAADNSCSFVRAQDGGDDHWSPPSEKSRIIWLTAFLDPKNNSITEVSAYIQKGGEAKPILDSEGGPMAKFEVNKTDDTNHDLLYLKNIINLRGNYIQSRGDLESWKAGTYTVLITPPGDTSSNAFCSFSFEIRPYCVADLNNNNVYKWPDTSVGFKLTEINPYRAGVKHSVTLKSDKGYNKRIERNANVLKDDGIMWDEKLNPGEYFFEIKNEEEGDLFDHKSNCHSNSFTVSQSGGGEKLPGSVNENPNASLAQPCQEQDLSANGDGCKRIKTSLGYVSTDASNFTRWVLGFILSISGGIVFLIILITGYRLMTSQGDPEKVKNAKDQLTAAIIGLMFIIFSLAILELITRDILGLPGFGS